MGGQVILNEKLQRGAIYNAKTLAQHSEGPRFSCLKSWRAAVDNAEFDGISIQFSRRQLHTFIPLSRKAP